MLKFRTLVATSVGLVASAVSAAASEVTYDIQHASYGLIGTYSNAVETNGDTTVVTTTGHIKVSVLGVVMFRQDLKRTERWADGRLVAFHSVTDENGKSSQVSGLAEGNSFLITSPRGTTVAPSTIQVANPWSGNMKHTDTLLIPDDGTIEKVRVSGGETSSVAIDGVSIPARRYQIDAPEGKRYDVWFDHREIPLRFDMKHRKITFTLRHRPVETAAAREPTDRAAAKQN